MQAEVQKITARLKEIETKSLDPSNQYTAPASNDPRTEIEEEPNETDSEGIAPKDDDVDTELDDGDLETIEENSSDPREAYPGTSEGWEGYQWSIEENYMYGEY